MFWKFMFMVQVDSKELYWWISAIEKSTLNLAEQVKKIQLSSTAADALEKEITKIKDRLDVVLDAISESSDEKQSKKGSLDILIN